MRQLGDFPMLEILLASDNPAQQNGRIDGRHLRIPHSFAGIYIRPVIEESSVIGQLSPQKSERSQSTLSCGWKRNPAMLLPRHSAVSPKPVAAMLATMPSFFILELHLSFTNPVFGL